MKTLQVLSFRITILSNLGIEFFSSNKSYYLRLLFPTIYRSIIFIQRKFRVRMAQYQEIENKINSLCSAEKLLMPTNSVFYTAIDWRDHVEPGFHLAVFCPKQKVYHHGIVVDINDEENAIIHCNKKNSNLFYHYFVER